MQTMHILVPDIVPDFVWHWILHTFCARNFSTCSLCLILDSRAAQCHSKWGIYWSESRTSQKNSHFLHSLYIIYEWAKFAYDGAKLRMACKLITKHSQNLLTTSILTSSLVHVPMAKPSCPIRWLAVDWNFISTKSPSTFFLCAQMDFLVVPAGLPRLRFISKFGGFDVTSCILWWLSTISCSLLRPSFTVWN